MNWPKFMAFQLRPHNYWFPDIHIGDFITFIWKRIDEFSPKNDSLDRHVCWIMEPTPTQIFNINFWSDFHMWYANSGQSVFRFCIHYGLYHTASNTKVKRLESRCYSLVLCTLFVSATLLYFYVTTAALGMWPKAWILLVGQFSCYYDGKRFRTPIYNFHDRLNRCINCRWFKLTFHLTEYLSWCL